ncbi:synaptoporin-like [Lethenteron reissneri]|uniref:synaptoporin-like n=1 Tax=Lethenteron reissneri TaxID=7753 RepID=UPI002AB68752|nr:synaptoporin-like [Lethenteron reissneri]
MDCGIFAILAFATCCGYHGELLFQLPCGNSSERLGDVHVPIQYPFRLLGVVARVSGCVPAGLHVRLASDGATVAMDAGRPSALPAGLAGVVPSARLLVAVGVVSLLYSLCATVATIFYQRNYLRNNRGPKIDVSVSLVLSLLWLLASCLWAASLAELRASLQPAHLGALVPACRAAAAAAAAAAGRDPRAAALPQALPAGMAAVFGFINWLLWTGNVWFVYKETGWRAPSLRPLLRHGSAFCASEPDLAASTRRGDRGGGGGAAASSAIGDRDFERAAGDHVLIDLGGQLGTSPKARLLQPQVSYHETPRSRRPGRR